LLLVKKKFLKPTGKLYFVDIKWDKITKFIEDAFKLYPPFIKKTKEFIKSADK